MKYNKTMVKNLIVYLGKIYGGHLLLYKNTYRLLVDGYTFMIYKDKVNNIYIFYLYNIKRAFIDKDFLRGLYRAWSYPVNKTIKHIPTEEDWKKIVNDANIYCTKG